MSYKVTIGSISHGTLRTEDLLDAFADELERIGKGDCELTAEHAGLIEEARAVLTLHAAGWNDIVDHEYASELTNALCDALSEYAPECCYFGAHDGDGSDFGFWPSMAALDDLPRFADLADVPADIAETYAIVNDHGNVAVYAANGELIWDCV
jgi:hypothetical protein